MALVNCSECGREISDKALNCPHCGKIIVGEEQVYEENNEKNNSSDLLIKSDGNPKTGKKENNFILYMIITALLSIILSSIISCIIASKIVTSSVESVYLSNESSVLNEVNVETVEEIIEDKESINVENIEAETKLTSQTAVDSIIKETLEEKKEFSSEQESEVSNQDLVLENGIIINCAKTTYKGDVYSIVNAKITDEKEAFYEVGFILNVEEISSIFTSVKLQCLDEDGFEISYFYFDRPETVGEFTSSNNIPKETKKIQICSE